MGKDDHFLTVSNNIIVGRVIGEDGEGRSNVGFTVDLCGCVESIIVALDLIIDIDG